MGETDKHHLSLLPATAICQQGLGFNPRLDDWQLSSSSSFVKISFGRLRAWATPAFIDSLKLALSVESRRLKARTLEAIMAHATVPLLRLAHMQSQGAADCITLEMLQAFVATLDARHQHQLGFLKMLAVALDTNGDPAHSIEPQAMAWMNKQRFRRNPQGEAVLTWDPEKGPLLQIEDRILMRAMHEAFETGSMPLHIYLKALLFRLSGMRPAQIADLKCKDLVLREGVYYLNYPQAKGRGELFRQSFDEWALVPEIGALIAGFIEHQKITWKDLNCSEDDLPLFPNPKNLDPIRRFHQVGGSLAKELPSYFSNLSVIDPISRKRVKIRSPRTGHPFHINMRRFRISLATWARLHGANLVEIATLLGHRTISCVGVYAAIDPEELEEMDRKMASSETITSGYFRGEVQEGTPPTRLASIYPEGFPGASVGACPSLCAQRKPFACYTCSQFRAVMEGPHDQVLKDLVEERDLIIQNGGTSQVNTHDMSIMAVKEVIRMRDDRIRIDESILRDLQQGGES